MSTLKVDGIRSNSATSDAITLASDGTCTANITNKPNRNLIINGAMQVAQRGTSSVNQGYSTVDRFRSINAGVDEGPTREQADVATGTTPYGLGFRKSFKTTNGNNTNGAGSSDYYMLRTSLEAQTIANSGWNYTSALSHVTLQFWVKSSVAQNFYGHIRTQDGTGQRYAFETGALSANTWTKVTKTIPGNSNLQFDNDTGPGLLISIMCFFGPDYTDNSVSLNTWGPYVGGTQMPDNTSTWYTTNDATFEITGVQLEVGSVATDFEHRSFADELRQCERYYQVLATGQGKYFNGTACNYTSTQLFMPVTFKTEMRSTPSLVYAEGSGYYQLYDSNNTSGINFNRPTSFEYKNTLGGSFYVGASHISGLTAGSASLWYAANAAALLAFDAEL